MCVWGGGGGGAGGGGCQLAIVKVAYMNLSNVQLHYLLVICLKMHVELNEFIKCSAALSVGYMLKNACRTE